MGCTLSKNLFLVEGNQRPFLTMHSTADHLAEAAGNQMLCGRVSLFLGKLLGGFTHFGTTT